jgi:hypothetical protein
MVPGRRRRMRHVNHLWDVSVSYGDEARFFGPLADGRRGTVPALGHRPENLSAHRTIGVRSRCAQLKCWIPSFRLRRRTR